MINNSRFLATPQSVNSDVKSICDNQQVEIAKAIAKLKEKGI